MNGEPDAAFPRLSKEEDDGLRAEMESLLDTGYRYALALTHDPNDAADLVQDAVVAILRAEAPRRPGYLVRTIRNRFIDSCRRSQIVVMQPLDEVDEGAALAAIDEPLELGETDIGLALAQLRPQEREALYLTCVESYTTREVAEMTGRPRGTVLSLVHRARAKIRDFLGGEREASG